MTDNFSPESRETRIREREENAIAQLLIELAFLLPHGTDIRTHSIHDKLIECFAAVRESVKVREGGVLVSPEQFEQVQAELEVMKAARQRVRDSFGHVVDGKCQCVYCRADADGLAEHAADYEMKWASERDRANDATDVLARVRQLVESKVAAEYPNKAEGQATEPASPPPPSTHSSGVLVSPEPQVVPFSPRRLLTVIVDRDLGAVRADADLAAAKAGNLTIANGVSEMYFHQLRLRAEEDPDVLQLVEVFYRDGTAPLVPVSGLTFDAELRWPVGFLNDALEIEIKIANVRRAKKSPAGVLVSPRPQVEEMFVHFRTRGACPHAQDAAGLCSLCVLTLFAAAGIPAAPPSQHQENTDGYEDRTDVRDERSSVGGGRVGSGSSAVDGRSTGEAGDVGARAVQQRAIQGSHVSAESERSTRAREVVPASPQGPKDGE